MARASCGARNRGRSLPHGGQPAADPARRGGEAKRSAGSPRRQGGGIGAAWQPSCRGVKHSCQRSADGEVAGEQERGARAMEGLVRRTERTASLPLCGINYIARPDLCGSGGFVELEQGSGCAILISIPMPG